MTDFNLSDLWDKLPEAYIEPIGAIASQFQDRVWSKDTGPQLCDEIKSAIDNFLKTQQVMRGDRLIQSFPALHGDQLTIRFSYLNQ